MKRLTYLLWLVICAAFTMSTALAQDEKIVLPPDYKVDTRIDNMGYWRKMAELGLVPVQPFSRVPAARYTGSKIYGDGILSQDSPDVPVTTQTSTQSENSIVADPSNGNWIVNSNNSTPQPSTGSIYGADWFKSADEGETWTGSIQGAGGSNSGDPAAVINLTGRWFIGYIDAAYGQSVSYSDNQGATWSVSKAGTGTLFNMLDKNHLWVDVAPTSPYKGYLYNGWMKGSDIYIARSITNGTSWETSIKVSAGTSAGSHNQGVNFKCGPNGEAYSAWAVYDSWPGDEKAIGFTKSTDGGITWQPATRILNNIRGIRTSGVAQNMRTNSFPCMAVDLSNGPNRGAIYITWSNIGVPGINTGSGSDVYLIKSTDQGTTWSAPMKINQDAAGAGKQHYFPWITVDQANGMVSIVFYDNRNVSATQAEAWLAYSADGGNTWEEMKVSDVSFTPQPIPNMASDYFGDYLGIDAFAGKVYPCWTDNRLGYAMTYVSPIELSVPLNKPVIKYHSHSLNDTTFGNGNGLMDYGETELLGLRVKNEGDKPADSVSIILSSSSPYITFTDNTEFYGDFEVNEIRYIHDAFKFTVSDSVPDNAEIEFTVKAADKYDTTTYSYFPILSHAPNVAILSMTIDDASGNSNGRLDPGESANLILHTQNTGPYNAEEVVSNLVTNNPYVTIGNPVFPIGTMFPGQTVQASFPVTVNPNSAYGSAAVFHNTATSKYAITERDFNARIGLIIEDWETGNFQKFPWQFYGQAGWEIDDTAHWEKLYSARSGMINTGDTSGLTVSYHAMLDDSISFYFRVTTEKFTNKLKFFIDDLMVGQWTSGKTWRRAAFPVLAGLHTFSWEFVKNEQSATGPDLAWVDYIVFPPQYKTTVNAGGNGTVCTGNTFQLQGLAFNYDSLRWNTAGDGLFSDATILDPVYTPGGQDIAAGSVTLNLTAYGEDGIDTTNSMVLTILPSATANAGGNNAICSGVVYPVSNSSAANHSSLQWTTSGDGTFDDATILHPTYTPGSQDNQIGSVRLHFQAMGLSICPAATDSMTLTIHALPDVNLGPDTVICANLSIVLDATVPDAASYLWVPGGQTTPTITIDSAGTGIGSKWYAVFVADNHQCSNFDTVTVGFKICAGIGELDGVDVQIFPNPTTGIFTIELKSLKQEQLDIRVLNARGESVYMLRNIPVNRTWSDNINVGQLPQGNYFIEISKESGKLIRKLVIRK